MGDQVEIADAKFAKFKREYFTVPLASIWTVTIDFVERAKGALGGGMPDKRGGYKARSTTPTHRRRGIA